MPGNCVFNLLWMNDPDFKDWIEPVERDDHLARCTYCKKDINVTTMGVTALNSHVKGDKHKKACMAVKSNLSISNMFRVGASRKVTVSAASSATEGTSSAASATQSCQSQLNTFVTKNDTLSAEVWWTLKSMSSNYSFNSSDDMDFVLTQMFPKEPVANKFQCGKTKSMYLACHGIAPYFKSLLDEKVKKDHFVMLFDESLNKQMQLKQLDIHVRFWHDDHIQTRYYDSQFLGHATADDLFDQCLSSLNNLGTSYNKIVQLSMDGPNVNWKFFHKFTDHIQNEFDAHLLDIGSCGLHQVHNAFRAGITATKWDLSDFLSSLHWLLHNVPARREDYLKYSTPNALFPLKFCAHRWVENTAVAQRAIDILPHVKAFIKGVENSKQSAVKTKSYTVVAKMVQDPLLESKLATFVSISKIVEDFLTVYQTDKPMVPFLAEDLDNLLRNLMRRFVKKDVLKSATSVTKLAAVDVTKAGVIRQHSKINSGFVSEKLVSRLRDQGHISERQVLEFHMETCEFMKTIVTRLLNKSPITFSLVRNLSCLAPHVLLGDQEVCTDRFKRVLTVVNSAKLVKDDDCDQILQQFDAFIRDVQWDEKFKEFKKNVDSLDKLYYTKIGVPSAYQKLWSVIRTLLLLSHGQATVERGFSINKQVMVENLSQKNLKCRRMIKDHLASVGGLKGVTLTPELLKSAASARSRYVAYLDQQDMEKESLSKKRKSEEIMQELEKMRKRQKGIEQDIKALEKSSEEAAIRAETSRNISYLTKFTNDRKRMKEKEEQLGDLVKEIEKKSKQLRWYCEGFQQRILNPWGPSQ